MYIRINGTLKLYKTEEELVPPKKHNKKKWR